jgi:hypothetical protein
MLLMMQTAQMFDQHSAQVTLQAFAWMRVSPCLPQRALRPRALD